MLNHKIEQMKEEMLLFSKTSDKDHLDSALKMKEKLAKNEKLDLVEALQINTKDLFESAFAFPSIA